MLERYRARGENTRRGSTWQHAGSPPLLLAHDPASAAFGSTVSALHGGLGMQQSLASHFLPLHWATVSLVGRDPDGHENVAGHDGKQIFSSRFFLQKSVVCVMSILQTPFLPVRFSSQPGLPCCSKNTQQQNDRALG